MVTTYSNYIDGTWINSDSGKTFQQTNPANTGEILGAFQDSTAEDTKRAITSSVEAFPEWKKTTPFERADILYRVMSLIEEDKDELATVIKKKSEKLSLQHVKKSNRPSKH